jgi:hypothetical protein
MRIYRAWNGPSPTTAAQVGVTTGTAIKTLLQIATPSTFDLTIVAWGISMNAAAAATGPEIELIETDVAATVTAHVAAGLVKMNIPTGPNSAVTLSTTATGYTATAEGTTTASRVFDGGYLQPTGLYAFRWPLGYEPVVGVSKFLRIRVTSAVAYNALCWIEYGE